MWGVKRAKIAGVFGIAAMAAVAMAFASCSAPRYEVGTVEGKAAILDATNVFLSSGDCEGALSTIENLYSSRYTDNEVRLIRASAHGCNAGINLFKLLGDLGDNDLGPPEFWNTMAKLFPSETTDSRAESAMFATDALMAALKSGTVVPTDAKVNSETRNPGSVFAEDRVDDSNFYMIFVSMALIGTLENRYGSPDSTSFNKGNALPWEDPADVDEDGCAFVGAIMNLLDSAGQLNLGEGIALAISSSVGEIEDNVVSLGCELGCQNPVCGFAAGECTPCPTLIRNRKGCDFNGDNDQKKAACAASGIVYVLNNDTSFGWLGP